eukprot:2453431-Pyramimonas_sp.AAC.1
MAPSTSEQLTGSDNHDSMKYLNERAEAWAARWIPSAFLGRDMDNFNDWMDWCVPYVAAVPHRPQFNAHFSLDDEHGSPSARRDMATEICCGAWHRAGRPRNHRLEIYNSEHRSTTHRELADEAAEHRARRRWIEHERAANPNFPQDD